MNARCLVVAMLDPLSQGTFHTRSVPFMRLRLTLRRRRSFHECEMLRRRRKILEFRRRELLEWGCDWLHSLISLSHSFQTTFLARKGKRFRYPMPRNSLFPALFDRLIKPLILPKFK